MTDNQLFTSIESIISGYDLDDGYTSEVSNVGEYEIPDSLFSSLSQIINQEKQERQSIDLDSALAQVTEMECYLNHIGAGIGEKGGFKPVGNVIRTKAELDEFLNQ